MSEQMNGQGGSKEERRRRRRRRRNAILAEHCTGFAERAKRLDEPCSMPRGAAGDLVLLQQRHSLGPPAHLGQVVGHRVTDHPSSDHHHPAPLRQPLLDALVHSCSRGPRQPPQRCARSPGNPPCHDLGQHVVSECKSHARNSVEQLFSGMPLAAAFECGERRT